ncbi:unnamed protein product [Schistocephalus solidus]|nr:unnamed protein product [Schistocephalus solidus]
MDFLHARGGEVSHSHKPRRGSRRRFYAPSMDRFPSARIIKSNFKVAQEMPFWRLNSKKFRRMMSAPEPKELADERLRQDQLQNLPFSQYAWKNVKYLFTQPDPEKLARKCLKHERKMRKLREKLIRKPLTEEMKPQGTPLMGKKSTTPSPPELVIPCKHDSSEGLSRNIPAIKVKDNDDVYRDGGLEVLDEHLLPKHKIKNRRSSPAHKEKNISPQSTNDSQLTSSKTFHEDEKTLCDVNSLTISNRVSPNSRNSGSSSRNSPKKMLERAHQQNVPILNNEPQKSPHKQEIAKAGKVQETSSDAGQLHPNMAKGTKATAKTLKPSGLVAERTEFLSRQIRPISACRSCERQAYTAESIEALGQIFHSSCFKCARCSTLLQRGSWNHANNKFYCNPCHRRVSLQTLRH